LTAPPRIPRHLHVPRSLRDHARLALSRGWTISVTGSGHLRWRAPDGRATVFTPRTPSDRRSAANVTAKLRRAGLNLGHAAGPADSPEPRPGP
jgi:hypothetical protein